MYLLLDTSDSTCYITIINGKSSQDYSWEAGRSLARNLLSWMIEALDDQQASLGDIKGLGVFRGPGSFTGLRIGLTVCNTLADSRGIPIVGAEGDSWQADAVERLDKLESDQLVLPLYGREARITQPKK